MGPVKQRGGAIRVGPVKQKCQKTDQQLCQFQNSACSVHSNENIAIPSECVQDVGWME